MSKQPLDPHTTAQIRAICDEQIAKAERDPIDECVAQIQAATERMRAGIGSDLTAELTALPGWSWEAFAGWACTDGCINTGGPIVARNVGIDWEHDATIDALARSVRAHPAFGTHPPGKHGPALQMFHANIGHVPLYVAGQDLYHWTHGVFGTYEGCVIAAARELFKLPRGA